MKRYISIFTIVCGALIQAHSQQISNASFIPASRAILNPAYTAVGTDMSIDGYFRMQWLGFSGAPVSGFVSFQKPFVKQNMSAGAFLHFDNTGPVSKIGIQLNYAYKLKELIGRRDQLSLGLSADIQQYAFNGAGQIANDINDKYLGAKQSAFFPSVGVGAFYMSTTREYKENMFFAGFSTNQALTTDVLVNDSDQDRARHFNASIGGRFYKYNSYIEPMISANLVQPDIINVLYGLRYELDEAFWAGLGYESAGVVAFQGGVILTNLGASQDGTMRLGALANIGISSGLQKTGPSLEFYISYVLGQ
jgi:type IX secretion system PorP/SprF family membrane protein